MVVDGRRSPWREGDGPDERRDPGTPAGSVLLAAAGWLRHSRDGPARGQNVHPHARAAVPGFAPGRASAGAGAPGHAATPGRPPAGDLARDLARWIAVPAPGGPARGARSRPAGP